MHDAEDRPIGVIRVVTDVTERMSDGWWLGSSIAAISNELSRPCPDARARPPCRFLRRVYVVEVQAGGGVR